jgi:hypothetical protein
VSLKLLSVFGLGMIGLWEGVPAGFALRLTPLLIGLLSALGSICATLLVTLLGDRVRARLHARLLRSRDDSAGGQRPERLIDRVWRRYGIVGLGLLGPGITGAPLGMVLGLFLRAPVGRLLPWTLAGILLWALVLTTLGALGIAGVGHLVRG